MSSPNFRIKIKFFPLSHGKITKSVLTDQNGNKIDIVPDMLNIAEVVVPVTLPASVTIEFSGKDYNHDTVVDADNNILEDLHVEILEIGIDCFNMSPHYLQQKLTLNTVDGKVIHSSYIGFNGQMVIDLPKTSVFQQIMQWTAI